MGSSRIIAFVSSSESIVLMLNFLYYYCFCFILWEIICCFKSRNTRYILLGDGRSLCLECMESAIMDTGDCQPLYHSIRDYYEGMNMRINQQIPMLLVERQALNEAIEGEKHVNIILFLQFLFLLSPLVFQWLPLWFWEMTRTSFIMDCWYFPVSNIRLIHPGMRMV